MVLTTEWQRVSLLSFCAGASAAALLFALRDRARSNAKATVDTPGPGPVAVALDDVPAPPDVSCRAWLVADAGTGMPLLGHNVSAQLQIASMTKIATALVVLRRCEEQARLDADGTCTHVPSTAGIGLARAPA